MNNTARNIIAGIRFDDPKKEHALARFIRQMEIFFINKGNIIECIVGAFSGSVIFFILTNLGVWISSTFYPKTVAGLVECYAMAVPFFSNTLLGSFFYTVIMFGGYELIKDHFFRYAPESIHK